MDRAAPWHHRRAADHWVCGYSLRKRKLITVEKPATLLRLHERMAWAGSLLILVDAGIRFNAILGWLAVWAMLVSIANGLTGQFLLQRALQAVRNPQPDACAGFVRRRA